MLRHKDTTTVSADQYTLRHLGFIGTTDVLEIGEGPSWIANKSFISTHNQLQKNGAPITITRTERRLFGVWRQSDAIFVTQGEVNEYMSEGTIRDVTEVIVKDRRSVNA